MTEEFVAIPPFLGKRIVPYGEEGHKPREEEFKKLKAELQERVDWNKACVESAGIASVEISRLQDENERLAAEHKQCHEQNAALCKEHTQLKLKLNIAQQLYSEQMKVVALAATYLR